MSVRSERPGRGRSVVVAFTAMLAAVGLAAAGAAPAQAATNPEPTAVTSFTYTSASGDYIGAGGSGTYKAPASDIAVSGTASFVTVTVPDGDGGFWSIDLAAPSGETLRPGPYGNAERAVFRTGRSPGLDVSSPGKGCNEVYGSFSVNQIQTDSSGAVTVLDANFTQHCESAAAPALKGSVKYDAFPLSYSYTSDQGDFIGGGGSDSYAGATSLFNLSGKATATGGLSYSVSGKRDQWSVDLGAPSGSALEAGVTYQTDRFGDNGLARLDATGDSRGCNESSGEFTISKLSTGSDGTITALAATFVQHCEGDTPALHGTIHYYA